MYLDNESTSSRLNSSTNLKREEQNKRKYINVINKRPHLKDKMGNEEERRKLNWRHLFTESTERELSMHNKC